MIVIEKMNPDNVSGVANLEKENFTDGWSEQSLREEIDNPYAIYLVAKDDEKDLVVGAAGIIISIDTADVMNVSVKSDYRRKAIAKRLLNELIALGKEAGVSAFTLEVRKGNEAARALYEKAGFVNEGIRPNFYDNPKEDAVIYWLR